MFLRKFVTSILLPAGLVFLLNACTPVGLAVGAGATAGSIILETRSLEDSFNDRALQAAINQQLADEGLEVFSAVSIDVVEGRVMLTGIVAKQEDRLNVAKHSWAEVGVEEVINEILVAPTIGIIDISSDAWIKAQLLSAITFDSQVLATNYEISVVGGRVYLFGISENNMEIDRVVAHAREVPSVRRVVSHMRNRDDPIRLKRLARLEAQAS